jgi:hypothetical protein
MKGATRAVDLSREKVDAFENRQKPAQSGSINVMVETMKEHPPGPDPSSLERFRDFVRRIVGVPKSEIDKEEAEYKLDRAKRRASRPLT